MYAERPGSGPKPVQVPHVRRVAEGKYDDVTVIFPEPEHEDRVVENASQGLEHLLETVFRPIPQINGDDPRVAGKSSAVPIKLPTSEPDRRPVFIEGVHDHLIVTLPETGLARHEIETVALVDQKPGVVPGNQKIPMGEVDNGRAYLNRFYTCFRAPVKKEIRERSPAEPHKKYPGRMPAKEQDCGHGPAVVHGRKGRPVRENHTLKRAVFRPEAPAAVLFRNDKCARCVVLSGDNNFCVHGPGAPQVPVLYLSKTPRIL